MVLRSDGHATDWAFAQLGRGITVAQDFARSFYKSPAWIKNRKSYLMRVIDTPLGPCPPGMCERCFERGKLSPAKVVHHKTHLSPQNIGDPSVTLSFDNMQRLCQDCHAEVHSDTEPSRITFNEDGTIAGPTSDDSFEARLQRLTETSDERRNIHHEDRSW